MRMMTCSPALPSPAASNSSFFRGATVVFDLDGTLVDTAPDLMNAVNSVLASEGLARLPLEVGRILIGRGARRVLEQGLVVAGVEQAADRAEYLFPLFLEYYSTHLAEESRPFAGVVDALTRLKENGAYLVVCTNKPTGLSLELLLRIGMGNLIESVIGCDVAPAMKPDPRHVLAALAVAGGDQRKAVLVGDSLVDALAARAAGLPFILVEFGYTEVPAATLAPDWLLAHFDDLVTAVSSLLDSGGRTNAR